MMTCRPGRDSYPLLLDPTPIPHVITTFCCTRFPFWLNASIPVFLGSFRPDPVAPRDAPNGRLDDACVFDFAQLEGQGQALLERYQAQHPYPAGRDGLPVAIHFYGPEDSACAVSPLHQRAYYLYGRKLGNQCTPLQLILLKHTVWLFFASYVQYCTVVGRQNLQ